MTAEPQMSRFYISNCIRTAQTFTPEWYRNTRKCWLSRIVLNVDPISQKKFRFLSAYTMQIMMTLYFSINSFSQVTEFRVLPVAQWTAEIEQCNTDGVLCRVSTDEQHYLEKVNMGMSQVINCLCSVPLYSVSQYVSIMRGSRGGSVGSLPPPPRKWKLIKFT